MAYVARTKTVTEEIEAYSRLMIHLRNYRNIVVLAFDEHAAIEYQRLRRSKLRIGTMDLKIAAIVLANDSTLLSRNLSDFRKIPGLRVEDWTVPREN
jgi:tRNA(fMet)-specific endonuclease VapC